MSKKPSQPTVARLNKMVTELLSLKASADRYGELKEQIKADMVALKWPEVNLAGQGRVFISPSERLEYPAKLVEDVLGVKKAQKVIQVKRFVSNEILAAFIKAEEISAEDAAKLDKGAIRTPVVSLNIRPLK